jgi:hypothetical protein
VPECGGSPVALLITPLLAVHGAGFVDPFSNPGFPNNCVAALFDTVTVTVGDVPMLFAASYAFTTSEWLPFDTGFVFQENESEVVFVFDVVSVPSMYNSIFTTPTLSLAVAVIVTLFDTVALFAGAVIDAVGGVVSDPDPGVVTGSETSSIRNVVGDIDPFTLLNTISIVCPAYESRLIAAGWK